jgi:hypothetical protein
MGGQMDSDDAKDGAGNMIDANLKRVYETVLQEEVPDRFAKLLAQLRAGEGQGAQDADGGES